LAIHSLLLAKLPVTRPEALRLVLHATDGPMRALFASGEVDALKTAGTFDIAAFHVAAAATGEINGVRTGGVAVEAVDRSFFRVAGVRMAAGRPMTETDVDGAAQVAVISHASANARFGSPAAALGKTITRCGRCAHCCTASRRSTRAAGGRCDCGPIRGHEHFLMRRELGVCPGVSARAP
jgi:hypothetical protein